MKEKPPRVGRRLGRETPDGINAIFLERPKRTLCIARQVQLPGSDERGIEKRYRLDIDEDEIAKLGRRTPVEGQDEIGLPAIEKALGTDGDRFRVLTAPVPTIDRVRARNFSWVQDTEDIAFCCHHFAPDSGIENGVRPVILAREPALPAGLGSGGGAEKRSPWRHL